MEALQFNSAAELQRHYGGIHQRLYGEPEPPAPRIIAPRQEPLREPPPKWIEHRPIRVSRSRPAPVDFIGTSGMRFIASYVAAKRKLPVERMMSKRRRRKATEARAETIFLIRIHTLRTMSEIGLFFGKDRTTAEHALRRHIYRTPGAEQKLNEWSSGRTESRDKLQRAVVALIDLGTKTQEQVGAAIGIDKQQVAVLLARHRRQMGAVTK